MQRQEKEQSGGVVSPLEELKSLLDEKTNKLTRRVVQLENGRQLSYSESGRTSGGGYPVLFHFGLMGSSLIVVLFHYVALELDLHLIAVDYPGIGDSTPQPKRSLRDWPRDIHDFCRQVVFPKSDTFALCCHSMGGPHGLAILNYPPLVSKISRVTFVSPWIMLDPEQEIHQHNNNNNNNNQQDKTNNNSSNDNNNNKKWMSERGNTSTANWIQQCRRFMPKFVQEHIIPPLATTFSTSTLVMTGSLIQVATQCGSCTTMCAESYDRQRDLYRYATCRSSQTTISSQEEEEQAAAHWKRQRERRLEAAATARLQVMAAQTITRYASKQGQGGNQQMVKLAITEVPPFVSNNNDNTTSSNSSTVSSQENKCCNNSNQTKRQGDNDDEKDDIPIFIFRGSLDSMVSEASCLHLLQRLQPHFSDIVYKSLDGAYHNNVMSGYNQRRIFKTLTPDFNVEDTLQSGSFHSHNNNNVVVVAREGMVMMKHHDDEDDDDDEDNDLFLDFQQGSQNVDREKNRGYHSWDDDIVDHDIFQQYRLGKDNDYYQQYNDTYYNKNDNNKHRGGVPNVKQRLNEIDRQMAQQQQQYHLPGLLASASSFSL